MVIKYLLGHLQSHRETLTLTMCNVSISKLPHYIAKCMLSIRGHKMSGKRAFHFVTKDAPTLLL